MGVKIKKQMETEGPFEQCILCHTRTPFWWADGCAPLCPRCASKTTDRSVYVMAEKEGYGPLPDWDDLAPDDPDDDGLFG